MADVLIKVDETVMPDIAKAIMAKTGKTDPLKITQFAGEISGIGQGGMELPEDMLEGLENGYDVMFYDENNMGLAFYSIKQGQGIYPPMYECSNWIDQNGTAIVFPYTPTADITLWANNSTLSSLLYDHFAVSPEEYPYIVIICRNGSNADSYFGFAKSFSTSKYSDGSTSVSYSDKISLSFRYNLYSSTIEEIVEYLIANFTSESLTGTYLSYQSSASYYKNWVNHSLSSITATNWEQFE